MTEDAQGEGHLNARLLFDLAWLFKVESAHESASHKTDGGESMRLFCIALELEEKARAQQRIELKAFLQEDLV